MTEDLKTRDEARMILSILSGETGLYHELIRPYERVVYMMAYSILKNSEDAEDAAQETFLNAFRKLGSFRSEAKFSTWLCTIALNEARGRLRRRSALWMESLDEPDGAQAVSPAALRDWREIPSESLERADIREMLQRAIGKLPDNYREVFLLRDVEGLDGQETSAALSISVGNVKVRLHRARMLLQRELAPKLKAQPVRKGRWIPWS